MELHLSYTITCYLQICIQLSFYHSSSSLVLTLVAIHYFSLAIHLFLGSIDHVCLSIHHSRVLSIKRATLLLEQCGSFLIYFKARIKIRSLSYSGASSVKSAVISTWPKPMSCNQVIYCSIEKVRWICSSSKRSYSSLAVSRT